MAILQASFLAFQLIRVDLLLASPQCHPLIRDIRAAPRPPSNGKYPRCRFPPPSHEEQHASRPPPGVQSSVGFHAAGTHKDLMCIDAARCTPLRSWLPCAGQRESSAAASTHQSDVQLPNSHKSSRLTFVFRTLDTFQRSASVVSFPRVASLPSRVLIITKFMYCLHSPI